MEVTPSGILATARCLIGNAADPDDRVLLQMFGVLERVAEAAEDEKGLLSSLEAAHRTLAEHRASLHFSLPGLSFARFVDIFLSANEIDIIRRRATRVAIAEQPATLYSDAELNAAAAEQREAVPVSYAILEKAAGGGVIEQVHLAMADVMLRLLSDEYREEEMTNSLRALDDFLSANFARLSRSIKGVVLLQFGKLFHVAYEQRLKLPAEQSISVATPAVEEKGREDEKKGEEGQKEMTTVEEEEQREKITEEEVGRVNEEEEKRENPDLPKQKLGYARPVILLGALTTKVTEQLLKCDRYDYCVSHTSRQPRYDEYHGAPFYFVTRKQMEEDIEKNAFIYWKEVKGELYGIAYETVREIAARGCHCLLVYASSNVMTRLQSETDLRPIYIFIQASSPKQIMAWDPSMIEFDARAQFARCQQVEQTHGHLCSHVVSDARSFKEIVKRVDAAVTAEARRLP